MASVESLAAAWALVSAAITAEAVHPPPVPTTAVLKDAAAGRVGRISLGENGVAGFAVLEASQAQVWLSLTDDRLSEDVAGLTEIAIEGSWSKPKVLYQRVDLPWPVDDRHWVLRLANNTGLAQACGVWERSWKLANDRLAESRERTDATAFDTSVTMSQNKGSWTLIPLDTGETFGVYQVWVDLGGNIPAEAAEAYTRSSLLGFVRGVEAHVPDIRARYGAGCTPQPGGDGMPIPCFGG